MTKDYYAILQVSPDAEQEVIEAAYRRLARKYHPDVYRGADASERMRGLNEAFEVLGDPTRRMEFDRHRQAGQGPDAPTFQAPPAAPSRAVPTSRLPGRWAGAILLSVGLGFIVIAGLLLVTSSEEGRDAGTNSVAEDPSASASPGQEWGPAAIWDWTDVQQFNAECAEGADFFTPLTEQDNACIVRVMLQDDAGPEAVDFFRATGLFLTEFEQIAEVDYAIATAPWVNQGRPNPLLLNGDPSVVSFGDLLGSGSMYRAIGDDILWPEYSTLELYEETDGGQRLTFNVRLAPCRACETTGSLEVVVEIIEGAVFRVSEARTD